MKYLLPLLLLSLFACEGNTAARKAARGPHFVADPDHLFFKNTRLRHYQAEEQQGSATSYRHDKLMASEATLIPVLLDNWLEDEATLRFDVRRKPTSQATTEPFRLDVTKDGNWQAVRLSIPATNEEIATIRQHLVTNRKLRLVMAADTLMAFPDDARAAAREMLDDYLRLVAY
ncbi:MAG: hypothetical protein AAGA62_11045 [Bacteroidota bacterium]